MELQYNAREVGIFSENDQEMNNLLTLPQSSRRVYKVFIFKSLCALWENQKINLIRRKKGVTGTPFCTFNAPISKALFHCFIKVR